MRVTVRHIQEIVAEHFHVSVDVMTGPRYEPNSPKHLARQTAMFFARRIAHKSYSDIAHKFARKDHTTAMHAERKVETRCQNDSAFASVINELASKLAPDSAVDKCHLVAFPNADASA